MVYQQQQQQQQKLHRSNSSNYNSYFSLPTAIFIISPSLFLAWEKSSNTGKTVNLNWKIIQKYSKRLLLPARFYIRICLLI